MWLLGKHGQAHYQSTSEASCFSLWLFDLKTLSQSHWLPTTHLTHSCFLTNVCKGELIPQGPRDLGRQVGNQWAWGSSALLRAGKKIEIQNYQMPQDKFNSGKIQGEISRRKDGWSTKSLAWRGRTHVIESFFLEHGLGAKECAGLLGWGEQSLRYKRDAHSGEQNRASQTEGRAWAKALRWEELGRRQESIVHEGVDLQGPDDTHRSLQARVTIHSQWEGRSFLGGVIFHC